MDGTPHVVQYRNRVQKRHKNRTRNVLLDYEYLQTTRALFRLSVREIVRQYGTHAKSHNQNRFHDTIITVLVNLFVIDTFAYCAQ